MDIYNVSMKSVSKADEGSIHAQMTISFINLLVLTIVQFFQQCAANSTSQ